MAVPRPRRPSSVPPGGEHRTGHRTAPGRPPRREALLINLLRSEGTRGAALLWKSAGLRRWRRSGRQLYKRLLTKAGNFARWGGRDGKQTHSEGKKEPVPSLPALLVKSLQKHPQPQRFLHPWAPSALVTDVQLKQQAQERVGSCAPWWAQERRGCPPRMDTHLRQSASRTFKTRDRDGKTQVHGELRVQQRRLPSHALCRKIRGKILLLRSGYKPKTTRVEVGGVTQQRVRGESDKVYKPDIYTAPVLLIVF